MHVAVVGSVAAAVVLLIPILKPSDKLPTTRVADAPLILPGETPREAEERIMRACMIEGGFTSMGEVVASENGGAPLAVATYKDTPGRRAREDTCHQRIEALGIIKPPTPEQFAAFYPHVVTLVDCLSANGFDMGTIISLDEYVSSGGDTPVSPKLVALESADEKDPKYRECLDKELIPYTSILRT